MTEWYSKLTSYFPPREMKSKEHMQVLFSEKEDTYKRDEGPEFIVVYFENDHSIFVDYILISGNNRGSGIGSALINRLKRKNKPIILEVEPITDKDPDSKKRVKFYERNGFQKADSISYVREHMVTGEYNEMDIYYWSPTRITEEEIYEKMRHIYEEVHAYKAESIYGKRSQTADEVLDFRKKRMSRAK
ncbi:GNAT family N-acetyltransferase [Peribacillus sp. SCS-155]|uniref:GNAT family N-acetyltransferase n=1 Tax=Peribacillus sedimenti TaxID=3115297 RepID=UPI0039061685